MLHKVLDNGNDRKAMRGEYSKGNLKLTYQGAITSLTGQSGIGHRFGYSE